MSNMMQKLVFAAAAAVLTTATMVASSAQARTETVRSVSYADLNLKADAGKATLAARVRSAAEAVCNSGGQSLREIAAEKKCVDGAVDAAMTKVASIS